MDTIPGITFPLLGEGIVWNFLPYFTIFGWKIYWYGVIIAVGFLLAVLYTTKRAPVFGLSEDDLIDTLFWAVPLGIIGARLYYVIFYHGAGGVNPYFDGENDLREIIAVWEGGLAIYGGVIGGVIGLVIATRIKKISTRAMADLSAFGLLIGQAVGRWGNFTNREAHGGETALPWRMGLVTQLPNGAERTFYYHPTFLYESLWNLVGFLLLHFWSKKHRKFDGQAFLAYVAWYGLGRLFIEGLRTDSLYVGNTNLRVSQLLAGLSCLIAVGILFAVRVFCHPEPEKLWVNRNRAAETTPAAVEAEPPELPAEENFDEKLSEALRILNGETPPENSRPEEESIEAPDAVGAEAGEEVPQAVPEAGQTEKEAPEVPEPPEDPAGEE